MPRRPLALALHCCVASAAAWKTLVVNTEQHITANRTISADTVRHPTP